MHLNATPRNIYFECLHFYELFDCFKLRNSNSSFYSLKNALLSWNIFANVYRIDDINIFLDKNVSTLNDCIVHLTSTCIILCILICLCTGHWNIKQIVSSYLFVIVQHLSFNNREVIMVCFTFLCLIDFYIFDCVEHNS